MKTKLGFLLPVLLALTPAPAGAAVRYVNVANPSPAPPYTNWASAATNIQDAVDAANAGDEIVVTNGVYATGERVVDGTTMNRVAVTKLLTLRSVNGPEVTVIQGYQVPGTTNGDGALRCVYLGEGAMLMGFTLTNGATGISNSDHEHEQSGGGVWCATTTCMVSNCVFSGNSAAYYGGGAYQGTLHNCTLTGNSAYYGGGASWGTLYNCTLTGNSANYGGGAVARLANCTLTGNWASVWGGGAYSGTLNNCTLTGNSANYGGGAAESTLANCTLTGNWAYEGGGAYSGTLNNCTLTGNSAETGGGVAARVLCIQNFCSGHAILHNCIVYFNQAQNGANYSDSRFEYSCTTPLPTGTGNIDSDPGFVDFAAGNLRLLSCSPCIDVGDAAFASGGFDLNGTRRIIGDTVDMGAFEFDQTQWILSNSIAIASAAIDHDGHFRVHLSSVSVGAYYILDRGTSIDQIRTPVAVALATNCDGVELVDPAAFTTQARAFYRIRAVPRTQPLDLDHDGIDDYYELRHAAFLNPFNPADAAQDTDGDGFSNLEEYRQGFDPSQFTLHQAHRSIASGLAHTVVLKQDGSLWAWGDNTYGQLGDGTYESRPEPVRIGTDTDWISVSAGRAFGAGDHTVALKRDGSLWAWGANTWGQLGYPPDQVPGTNVPVRVGNSSVWVDVSAGGGYTAALQHNGSLWMWGNNNWNILSCCNSTWIPTRVGTDTDWTTLSAGGTHILALKSDRSLWAWGNNIWGQCGLGEVAPDNSPMRVGTDNDWIAIAASGDPDPFYGTHSLGLKADGTLWSWGYDQAGELGLGHSDFIQLTPARVGTDTDWAAIAAGAATSLARKRDGSLWAWGWGIDPVPKLASLSRDWRDFAAGGAPGGDIPNFANAVAADGSLWAWPFGQPMRVPVRVGAETNWAAVSAGYSHSLALKRDGSLWSWGLNYYGQLGDGTFMFKGSPIRVASNMTWTSVSAGSFHTTALRDDGTLWSWGGNYVGQLGIGTFFNGTNTPQPVATNATWLSAAAGGAHTAALRADGSLWTWGHGGGGQLGNGVFATNLASPFSVEPGATWRSVSAGAGHTIGLRSDGSLWAWGFNYYGQLGLGLFTTNEPFGVSTLQRVPTNVVWRSITAGGDHTVALDTNEKLWAWGNNSAGQLGNGSADTTNSPQSIASDKTWKAVAAGSAHTVALDSNGALWTWGNTFYGQLGIGTLDNSRNTPQPVQPNTTWKAIAAGWEHTLAIRDDGTLWSWGRNNYGQLGIARDLTPTRLGPATDWGPPP